MLRRIGSSVLLVAAAMATFRRVPEEDHVRGGPLPKLEINSKPFS